MQSSETSPAAASGLDDPARLLAAGPVLLYDGECGVCASSVQWILEHEQAATLRFAPLKSARGQVLRAATGISDEVDSLIWVSWAGDRGAARARIYSDAVLEVLAYVGGPWGALSLLLRLLPAPLRNWGYRLFARHRSTFAPNQCLLPTVGQRARFLGT